jgi:hypothetical protein
MIIQIVILPLVTLRLDASLPEYQQRPFRRRRRPRHSVSRAWGGRSSKKIALMCRSEMLLGNRRAVRLAVFAAQNDPQTKVPLPGFVDQVRRT